ncbi:5'/3'-nucleotidase SurE [Fulvimarina sp. 2208YS6-2-32]|uniref:5'-nucleotidase SurE n=1 Tax=Fulvimarina uroteuthidis TaxID=3098149 RepID=A0ABU5I5E4_9HYPH|nr:5'/3'-nucleotidase SurE [Fulvimarina sp. 2208YS6-2-32]MDY8110599.1 5'/3'-nucleotidase SurE [Fulvimarina sp. 2208YS6-2-32]
MTRILITNDDGIHSDGLEALERIAAEISDDVWTVAPETDQSGLAHSITLSTPLRLRQIGAKRFALSGTPTDCVIMATRKLMDAPPDLVLSGINIGQNVADDLTYSGTVAGAMEGAMLGIKSIALSQAFDRQRPLENPWATAERHAPAVIERLMHYDLPGGHIINVNFPVREPDAVEGTRVTRQGKLDYALSFDEREDGRGHSYYWLRFGRQTGPTVDRSDLAALQAGYISVTPVCLDLTAERMLGDLEDHFGA